MYTLPMQWPVLVRLLSLLLSFAAIGMAAAQDEPTTLQTSPALRQLLGETLEQNPGVQAARAAVEAAEARGRDADRPLYNPELELDAEQVEIRTGTVGLSQAIDWADKRGACTEVKDAGLENARAEYAAVRQQLAGDTRQVELELARLARTQATLQLSQSASELAEAEQALAAITGSPRRDWPLLPDDLHLSQTVDADTLLKDLPALRTHQTQVNVARSTVTLRRCERQPDPTIGMRAGQERGFRNGNNDSYGVAGMTLSIPLYVRNSLRAEVEAAGAEQTQAEQSLQDAYRRARAQLLSAAERYRLSRGAWAAWQASGQVSLGSQVALLERIWRTGEMSTADYLVQIHQTLDTRLNAREVQGRL